MGVRTPPTYLRYSLSLDIEDYQLKCVNKKGRAIVDPALEFHIVEGETGETSCIMRGEFRITGSVPTFIIRL